MQFSNQALDARARRAAARCGLRAIKSRAGIGTVDNACGFQLLNENVIVAGERCDLSAEDVIEYCTED